MKYSQKTWIKQSFNISALLRYAVSGLCTPIWDFISTLFESGSGVQLSNKMFPMNLNYIQTNTLICTHMQPHTHTAHTQITHTQTYYTPYTHTTHTLYTHATHTHTNTYIIHTHLNRTSQPNQLTATCIDRTPCKPTNQPRASHYPAVLPAEGSMGNESLSGPRAMVVVVVVVVAVVS